MIYGFYDKVAWIDLTARTVTYKPLGEDTVRDFIGGGGIGAKLLSELVDVHTDPLGPDNPLIMMTGPFTGTKVPAGSRYAVVSLSPLTGIYGENNAGGTFGTRLKGSGLDGLVITGASQTPVSIIIDEEGISFRASGDLWGSEYFNVDDTLKTQYGKAITVAAIGPAGEKQALVAGIMHDGRHTRAAGRCGVGAVMGSKMLKAVIIKGNARKQPPIFDAEGLAQNVRERIPYMQERLEMFGKNGTPGAVQNNDRLGSLPINNWRDARAIELAAKTGALAMQEQIQVKRAGCRGCPIVCGRVVEVKDGPYATDGVVEAPEYENLAGFGSLQLNDNLEALNKANELCNTLGLDTISTSGVIAFANECWEKGLITGQDTGGLELGFAKPDVVIELVRRIGNVEGNIGRLLAQGVRKAAAEIGNGAEEYAMHVKGLEPAYHDPRFSWTHAVSYPTAARGADHLATLGHMFETASPLPDIGYDEPQPPRELEGKAKFAIDVQNMMAMMDNMIVCKFMLINRATGQKVMSEWLRLVTGIDLDVDGFQKVGARTFNLKRVINNWRGITRKDDILPPRWRTLKKVGEDVNLQVPPAGPLLSDYYDLRGWTEEGRPSAAALEELGLSA